MSRMKYIMSGGLAFSENKDMEKLRKYSLKGWHVREFKFMGYLLEKDESKDYIYNIDYRLLEENEKEEYFNVFTTSGWFHVASEGDVHLFRAKPGTRPIYTDNDTTIEKYENSSNLLNKSSLPLILLTIVAWIGSALSTAALHTTLEVIAIVLTIIAVPAAFTLLAAYRNKWKVEGKRGLVTLTRLVPYLFILAGVIALLSIFGSNLTVKIITSALIGGVGLPLAIWLITSVYYKVKA
ncbi:hypothetical protein GGQ92_002621 [Gracilibacillus halotolerans]|uniref:DUF2812 domain-containing protein n=1 Tax=Gracilibacillus halotolerans TaxID=74386 RepID=A0A841RPL1_9BACI|nr:DUF2812 domain-containing protein [Gracilibacillus halotolerans]MBB6513802.1 hypothetical protein [Gracilibacillus halotolerans]